MCVKRGRGWMERKETEAIDKSKQNEDNFCFSRVCTNIWSKQQKPTPFVTLVNSLTFLSPSDMLSQTHKTTNKHIRRRLQRGIFCRLQVTCGTSSERSKKMRDNKVFFAYSIRATAPYSPLINPSSCSCHRPAMNFTSSWNNVL